MKTISQVVKYFFNISYLKSHIILTIGIACILIARQPQVLLHADLFKEDAFVFFKLSYEKNFISAVTSIYAGYLHVLPHALARLCFLLPLEWIPTSYVLVSISISALSISFFHSKIFSHVVPHNWLRGFASIVMALMPMGEATVTLNHIQWFTLLYGCLFSICAVPSSRIYKITLFLFYYLAAWSTPALIVTAPVIVIRAIRSKDKYDRILWALSLTMLGLYFFICHSSAVGQSLHISYIVSLLNAYIFRVVCIFTLGLEVGVSLLNSGWIVIWFLTLFVIFIYAPFIIQSLRVNFIQHMWILYYSISISFLIILRPSYLNDFITISSNTWAWHGRYFVVPVFMLCIYAAVVFSQCMPKNYHVKLFVCAATIMWLCLHAMRFSEIKWSPMSAWKDTVEAIHKYESYSKESTHVLNLEASPGGWFYQLSVVGKSNM